MTIGSSEFFPSGGAGWGIGLAWLLLWSWATATRCSVLCVGLLPFAAPASRQLGCGGGWISGVGSFVGGRFDLRYLTSASGSIFVDGLALTQPRSMTRLAPRL